MHVYERIHNYNILIQYIY